MTTPIPPDLQEGSCSPPSHTNGELKDQSCFESLSDRHCDSLAQYRGGGKRRASVPSDRASRAA
jgi:hypothetical protein